MNMKAADPVRILLVEDDKKLSRLTREFLEENHFVVSVESRGDRVINRFLRERPDLVILDILLPGKNGRQVCRELRPQFAGPIMMLTALGEEVDEVLGLEIGADDYIAKPVTPRLLLSRINALLRRTKGRGQQEAELENGQKEGPWKIEIGSIEVDAGNRTVLMNGEAVDLTTAEFDLLSFLVQHPGEVLSRDRIYHAVRGIDYDGIDRSIDIRIARLRKKLGDDGKQPRLIKSIRGEGYLLVQDP